MSKRYTVLPCNLKVRLLDGMLQLRGDYGASENDKDRARQMKFQEADLPINDSARNLRALADFFAKEAEREGAS